jgi:phosphatidylinositol 3-kinase
MLSVRSFNSADSFPSPDKSELAEASTIAPAAELESPSQENVPLLADQSSSAQRLAFTESSEEYSVDLPTFLIQRACANSALANYFYWYLMIECEDPEPNVKHDARVREMYLVVMKKFLQVRRLSMTQFSCFTMFVFFIARHWLKAEKNGDAVELFSAGSSSFSIDSCH